MKNGKYLNINNLSNTDLSPIPIEQLWLRYVETKDLSIKTQLLTKYAYLVRYVIGRMKISLVPTLDHDDLESAGAIGLIKAMDRFDPSRHVKFETYAYRWIQGSVLDYVRQLDFLSRSSRERITKFKQTCLMLREKLGRNPTDEEMAQELGVDQRELNLIYFEMSCEWPLPLESAGFSSDDSSDERTEIIEDVKDLGALIELEKEEMCQLLRMAIDGLPEKEKLLIALYYFEELTFKQIGEILGVSESRICQMHGKAIIDIHLHLNKKFGFGEKKEMISNNPINAARLAA